MLDKDQVMDVIKAFRVLQAKVKGREEISA
jgi:hypothetical protein